MTTTQNRDKEKARYIASKIIFGTVGEARETVEPLIAQAISEARREGFEECKKLAIKTTQDHSSKCPNGYSCNEEIGHELEALKPKEESALCELCGKPNNKTICQCLIEEEEKVRENYNKNKS